MLVLPKPYGAIFIVFISCIGLFGLSVLAAQRRTAEMGIRKVLGASVTGIATMLLMDFLQLVFIAMVIAMPFAWFAGNKWLQNYAYRIPFNWEIFGVAGMIIVLIACMTISGQAIKTAKANPVRSIRRA